MKAKFISTVVRAASVAAIPLAILVVAVPASAQHSGKRNPSERRRNGDQEAIAQMQRDRAGVIGVDPRESIGYGNSSERQDRRYQNENDENDHYKNKNKNRKHGDYKSKNRNYKNGYYRHGRGHDDYDNNRNDNERGANGRYPGRYPSRGAGQYPSSPVIPGFPSSSVPNGRGGKTLPGTNPQYQRAHSPYRGN